MLKWDPPQVIPKGKIAVARPSKAGGSGSSTMTVEELLDAVVAPRTSLTNDGGQWVQRISSTPATKTDVVRLQESLDQQLLQKQARETGICPVREGLYREGFDEVIRQVSVSSGERGLLLLRVRDEIRMVMSSYQTLYESSIAFGMRKALLADQKKRELQARIKICSAELSDLERVVETLTAKAENMEAAEKEREESEQEKHKAEVEKLQATNVTLKEELDMLLAPPRK